MQQAEAIADTVKETHGEADLVTKKDLQIELAPIKSDLLVAKWTLALVLVGTIALVLKSFFPV